MCPVFKGKIAPRGPLNWVLAGFSKEIGD